METLKMKTLSFPRRVFKTVAASLLVMLTLSACGNNGGGSNNAINPYGGFGISGCANCSGMMAPTIMAQFNSQNASGAMMLQNVQVYGNGQQFMGGISPSQYSGPVALAGMVLINQPVYDPATGGCYIQPGNYQLTTMSQGVMQGGFIQMPDVMLTPGNIHLTFYQTLLDQGNTRLYGSIFITNVNGQPCSQAFSDVFQ